MRPRLLFLFLFAWLVFTGGRFTAPFLENVANFSDTAVGIAFAVEVALGAVMGSIGGSLADYLESLQPHRGRVNVVMLGTTIGTLAFMGHGLVRLWSLQNERFSIAFHFCLRVLYAIGLAFVAPVLDGVTLAFLEAEGSLQSDFGKERLWGAIGWAVASVVLGPLLDRWGFHVFYILAPLSGIASCLACEVYARQLSTQRMRVRQDEPDRLESVSIDTEADASKSTIIPSGDDGDDDDGGGDDDDDDNNNNNKEQSMEKGGKSVQKLPTQTSPSAARRTFSLLSVLCISCYGVGFLLSSVTLSMGTSVVERLIFIYFNELGSSNTMCGFTVVVTVVFELPIFQLAPSFLQWFGPQALLNISNCAYIVRVVGYTLIPRKRTWLLFLLEPLHGVTYACSKTAQVEHVAKAAPKGLEATGQGLMNAFIGFGSVIGLSLGGWTEQQFGAKIMYRLWASVVFVGMVAFQLLSFLGGARHLHMSKSKVLKRRVSDAFDPKTRGDSGLELPNRESGAVRLQGGDSSEFSAGHV